MRKRSAWKGRFSALVRKRVMSKNPIRSFYISTRTKGSCARLIVCGKRRESTQRQHGRNKLQKFLLSLEGTTTQSKPWAFWLGLTIDTTPTTMLRRYECWLAFPQCVVGNFSITTK